MPAADTGDRDIGRLTLVVVLLAGSWAAGPVRSHPSQASPSYLVSQLERFSSAYWARAAGRDEDLPPHLNGHDEFATAWTRAMRASLGGLPIAIFSQRFPAPGFHGLPAQRAGRNVVVIVPGSHHPDQAILIGAHYDGEPFSQGSTYDDTSGCMIMLGLAKILGRVWRGHGLPALTVEFVLFDAEEQGLGGSNAYTFAERHGALMPRPVLMLDEEQNGVGYPARPFGLLSKRPLPSYAITSAPLPRHLIVGPIHQPSQSAITQLQQRLITAAPMAFAVLRRTYGSLSFRDGSTAAFMNQDERYLHIGPGTICCSDNAPFAGDGVPTVILAGTANYYSPRRSKPSWAYPFDQPQDTMAALACDTGGSPRPGPILAAALALPLRLSAALVAEYAHPAAGTAITVVSSPAVTGRQTKFAAAASGDVRWSFGDGGSARGGTARHIYARPGRYHLVVRAGERVQSYRITVSATQPSFSNPVKQISPPPIIPWHPAPLQAVPGCP